MRNNTAKVSPLTVAFILLLLAALIGGIYLTRQNQETRRGAYFAGAKVFMQPQNLPSYKIGDNVPVQLFVETTNGAKVSAVDTKICYGAQLKLDAADVSTLITLNQNAFRVIEYADDANNCLRLVAVSSGISPDKLGSGVVQVAAIRFKAIARGSGQILPELSTVKVSGYNPAAGATDTSMKIDVVGGAAYNIVESFPTQPQNTPTSTIRPTNTVSPTGSILPTNTVSPTGSVVPTNTVAPTTAVPTGVGANEPYLKFNVALAGVFSSAKCQEADDTKLTVSVRTNSGVVKTYENVTPTMIASANGGELIKYHVELKLVGFNTNGEDFAVFVKGPKHLQVKYGVNNQDSYYTVAGGELNGLTADLSTTPLFNFTGYPLLAGDVTGETAGVQDGMVDGIDFSYVKSEAIKRTDIAEGSSMAADLNGNCKMESQDVSLLMLSLAVKQEQLY